MLSQELLKTAKKDFAEAAFRKPFKDLYLSRWSWHPPTTKLSKHKHVHFYGVSVEACQPSGLVPHSTEEAVQQM